MVRTLVVTILFGCLLSGCSTTKPVDMPADELQQRLSAGEILSSGDKVKIQTADGQSHSFKVSAVTEQAVLGKGVEIAIDDIVGVATREFSGGKTAALAGGSVAAWVVIVALALGGTLAL